LAIDADPMRFCNRILSNRACLLGFVAPAVTSDPMGSRKNP